MNTNIIGRRAARALAVVLLASAAAIGLTACQTGSGPGGPGTDFCDRPEAARSDADRELWRATRRPGCRGDRAGGPGRAAALARLHSHHVVEHPEGGYHLVCVQARD